VADFRSGATVALQGRGTFLCRQCDNLEEQVLDFLRIGRHAWFSMKGFTLTCDVLTAACRKIWKNL
jgi:hypothetical protein